MKNVKVLGTGCANCKNTVALVEQVAREKEVQIEQEKVEDLPTIMGYGVMSTPGVVIDGVVVHAGASSYVSRTVAPTSIALFEGIQRAVEPRADAIDSPSSWGPEHAATSATRSARPATAIQLDRRRRSSSGPAEKRRYPVFSSI